MNERITGLVSIVIPLYNAERYILETIESCLHQSYGSIEILVIDDGSTDRGAEVVSRVVDPRVRYIRQENQERSRTRNNGILIHSRGEFLQFLDADDLLSSEKLARQVAYLQAHPELGGVSCQAEYFATDAPDVVLSIYPEAFPKDYHRQILERNFFPICSPLVRWNSATFDASLSMMEDWDYWIRLIDDGLRFGFVPEVGCRVRIHGGNTSRNVERMQRASVAVIAKNRHRYSSIWSLARCVSAYPLEFAREPLSPRGGLLVLLAVLRGLRVGLRAVRSLLGRGETKNLYA